MKKKTAFQQIDEIVDNHSGLLMIFLGLFMTLLDAYTTIDLDKLPYIMMSIGLIMTIIK
jgi:hypothetical protein